MEYNRFVHFMNLIGRSAKSIQKIKTARMAQFDLSAAHTDCLCQLLAGMPSGVTQSQLTAALQMDRAQVSRVLRELCAKGLAMPVTPESYKTPYCLTESGVHVAGEIRNTITEIHAYVSGDIPDEDIAVFYQTLQTISDNLSSAVALYSHPEKE